VSTTAHFSVHHHRSPSVHQSSHVFTGAHMSVNHSPPVFPSELLCLFTTVPLSVHRPVCSSQLTSLFTTSYLYVHHKLCDFSPQLTCLLSIMHVSVHQSLCVFTTVHLYTRPHVWVCVCFHQSSPVSSPELISKFFLGIHQGFGLQGESDVNQGCCCC